VGGTSQRLRFRRTNEWDLQVEGEITGGALGSVVTNLAAFYRLAEDGHAVGANGDSEAAIWLLETNGDLTFIGALTAGDRIAQIKLNSVSNTHLTLPTICSV
jgi:hypothetical protein